VDDVFALDVSSEERLFNTGVHSFRLINSLSTNARDHRVYSVLPRPFFWILAFPSWLWGTSTYTTLSRTLYAPSLRGRLCLRLSTLRRPQRLASCSSTPQGNTLGSLWWEKPVLRLLTWLSPSPSSCQWLKAGRPLFPRPVPTTYQSLLIFPPPP